MAGVIIKVATDEVRSKANQVSNQRSVLENLMNDMRSQVDLLSDYFKSESGSIYVQKYQDVTKNINNSLEAIQVQINNLNAAADEYDRIESEQKQKANALSSDGGFSS